MSNLTPYVHKGEVIEPGRTVKVIGRPKPLKAAKVELDLPAGLTVAELLETAVADQRSTLVQDYAVYVDGIPIPPEWRDRIRLKPGRVMTFEPRLGKGDLARQIALIAVAVVALVVATVLLGPAGTLFVTSTFVAGLAAAGIVIAGTLAVNALFPIPAQKEALAEVQNAKTRYSITGTQNQANPYGPITAILGKVRTYPRYAALPFSSFQGQDQFLRLLFCVGYGPLELSEFKIGETDLDDFDNVSVESFEGYPADDEPTLYTQQATEESLSITLTEEADWQQRTTGEDIDEISLDFLFPQGLYEVNATNGKLQKRRVRIQAQYRIEGSADPWEDLAPEIDIEKKKQEPFRQGMNGNVTRGPSYDVRVRKASNDLDDDEDGQESLVWSCLRQFRGDPTINFRKPLALIALKIKATDQLNSVIDSFNCIAEARVTSFDGTNWDLDTISRNPADAFRWVLQGPQIYDPIPDEQIDLDSLEAWHQYCETEGWEYNAEHNTKATVRDQLQTVASAGRGRVVRTDGKWGVIWDELDAPVAQHFTPRNSWGFEEVRTYFDPPHAVRIKFLNQFKRYKQDEIVVYADGYDAAHATIFESWEFPGVTDPDLLWRLARFQMAQAILRPATYTLNTNWQALSCTVGDRVYVNHDVAEWGLQSARVAAIAGDDVTLDEEIVFELGTEYLLRFRTVTNESVLRVIAPAAAVGATRNLTLVADIDLPNPAVGDLVQFGNDVQGPAVLLRVRDIEWLPDLRARIALVDDAPEINEADTGEIPPFDSQITEPSNLFLRPPTDLRAQEVTYVEESIGRSSAHLSWLATPYKIQSFEIQMQDEGAVTPVWEFQHTVPSTQLTTTIPDLEAGTYSFRVRCLFSDGSWSTWVTATNIAFDGFPNPPDVSNFRIAVLGDVATLSWDPIFGQGVTHYVVRFSPLTEEGAVWGTATILVPQISSTSVQVPAINGTYLIKAVTSDSLESINPATLIALGAGLRFLNVVETTSPAPHWLGDKTDCFVDTEGFLELELLSSGTSTGLYEFDYSENIDLGEVFTVRINAEIMAFGSQIDNFISGWTTLSSVASLAGSTPSDWTVRLEERHTADDPNGSPVEWSEWAELIVGDVTARAFEFRLYLISFDASITVVVEDVSVHVDMPDRIDSFGDRVVTVSGLTITFDAPFRHLELVQVTAIQDALTGDHPVVTAKDETSFTVFVKDSAEANVQRTIDAVAIGYGRRVT